MDHEDIEAAYRRLSEHPDFRIQRRVEVEIGRTGAVPAGESLIAVVLDVEATSTDPRTAQIIELALRRFRFDGRGVIIEIGGPNGWLQDPGEPLTDDVKRLTSLNDDDLAGNAIDEIVATKLLRAADVIISHGASYDRPIVERHLAGARGLQWACSLTEIDWARRGFPSRRLGDLLRHKGLFHDAHRAGPDVDAVIRLLYDGVMTDDSALRELIDTASKESWIIRAVGADYGCKDALRRRGYRWDADDEIWWRHVYDADRMGEEFWLARNVYAAEARPKALGPKFERVDWSRRHA